MKLIVEQKRGTVFVYREGEKLHRKVQRQRESESPRLDEAILDNECDISGLGDFHMVFSLLTKR